MRANRWNMAASQHHAMCRDVLDRDWNAYALEIKTLVVLMYMRFLLNMRNVEKLLFKRGIDISHETARYW